MTTRFSTACFVALLLVFTASYARSEPPLSDNLVSSMTPPPRATAEWDDAHLSDALQISILSGQGATNDSRRGRAVQPAIQVFYDDNTPAAGVSVTITAPSTGPSVTFSNGHRSVTLTTDRFGRATLTAMTPVGIGEFKLTVVASIKGLTATTYISQNNRDDTPVLSGGSHARKMSARSLSIILAVIAASSLAAALTVAHEEGSSASSSALTATIGVGSTVTVGVPH
jgi:hypothetical protein